MENSNFMSEKAIEKNEDKCGRDFEMVVRISKILKSMGFETSDRLLQNEVFSKNWEKGLSFPLVEDGAEGIRVSVSASERPKIWFANGFENPRDPRRQDVVARLIQEGLGDNVNRLGFES